MFIQISLHEKDKALLEEFKNYFNAGSILKHGGAQSIQWISSLKELKIIIDHFEKFPLITQKCADYELWKQVYYLMERGEHLTLDGLHKIVAIKASMNFGLNDQLKEAFPNIIPADRPLVIDQKIKDPFWLAGFTSAEGCLFINIYKSATKVGEAVKLNFYLTQHKRDDKLMISLIEYFNCGNIYKKRETFNFEVSKFSDMNNKVIPFFQKYPIHGIKTLDFDDWCKVAELINEKNIWPKRD